jgi:hypothetical protein
MRTRYAVSAVILTLASTAIGAAVTAPANIAGRWQFTVELSMGTGSPVVTFEQEGEKITGIYEGRYGTSKLEGTVKDNQVEFTIVIEAEGTRVAGVFSGVYENDRMRGNVEYEGAGDGTWTAVRIPAKP